MAKPPDQSQYRCSALKMMHSSGIQYGCIHSTSLEGTSFGHVSYPQLQIPLQIQLRENLNTRSPSTSLGDHDEQNTSLSPRTITEYPRNGLFAVIIYRAIATKLSPMPLSIDPTILYRRPRNTLLGDGRENTWKGGRGAAPAASPKKELRSCGIYIRTYGRE